MDINRLPNDNKLHLCKSFFLVGFVFLPFVWAVNAVWFYQEAFVKPPYTEQKKIRQYVVLSGLGAVIWAAILLTWVIIYQTHRVAWGDTGDALSFVLPLGRA